MQLFVPRLGKVAQRHIAYCVDSCKQTMPLAAGTYHQVFLVPLRESFLRNHIGLLWRCHNIVRCAVAFRVLV